MNRCFAAVIALGLAAGPATAAEDAPPSAAELHQANLRYLVDSGQPQRALIEASARPTVGEAVSPALIAQAMVEYGLLGEAQQRYDALPRSGDDPLRARAWLSLAEAWYDRGRYDDALSAVRRVFGRMPERVERTTGALEGRILLAQGQTDAAIKRLRKTTRQFDDPLTRYNLGVAMVRAGKNEQGAAELNQVGEMDAETPEQQALRDKANLVLAFGFLEAGQGATARTLFKRVRLDGPFSNRALLGLGWAEVAPDGEPQTLAKVRPIPCMEDPARQLPESLPVLRRMPREACGPPRMHRQSDTFDTDEGGESEAERYRRALVPWSELAERRGGELAIQEALVAVPYAYQKLGALDRAANSFGNAASRLESHQANVEAARKAIDENEAQAIPADGATNIAWLARRWSLSQGDHSAYFSEASANPEFQRTAGDLRALVALRQSLGLAPREIEEMLTTVEGYIDSIERNDGDMPEELPNQRRRLTELAPRVDELRGRLDEAITAHDRALRDLAKAGLQAYKRYLNTYLKQARRGQAGVYDAAPGGAGRSTQ